MSDNEVLTKWNEFKGLVEALDHDVLKSAKGVAAAGVRVRKALRELKAKSSDLVKATLTLEKSLKEQK